MPKSSRCAKPVKSARGATAYVTLEPCAHFGRTPPCADALIAAGVGRVVIAHEDPFDKVAGAGIEKLRAAGIGVQVGLMRDAAHELNIGFFSRIQRGRPWVRVKLAMSLDGRTALADGSSTWITGEAARADVQRWRARCVGDTFRQRHRARRRSPLDGSLARRRTFRAATARDPRHAAAYAGGRAMCSTTAAPTVLLHAPDNAFVPAHLAGVPARRRSADDDGGGLDLRAALHWLAQRDVNEVHVEAGPVLCGALLAAGLADELLVYIAPVLLGHTARPMLTPASAGRHGIALEAATPSTAARSATTPVFCCARYRPARVRRGGPIAVAPLTHVRWGIVGCGAVTEVKSGPAFAKVTGFVAGGRHASRCRQGA